MKLELKHLTPYYPYDLKVQYFDDERGNMVVCDISELRKDECTILDSQNQWDVDFYELRPILRPMSDLDKTILTKDGYRNFAKINELYKDSDGDWVEDVQADQCESPFAQIMVTGINWWLFENHFDVFGLIEKGLAIDINTLDNGL